MLMRRFTPTYSNVNKKPSIQSLGITYHPIATFIHAIGHDINMNVLGCFKVTGLNGTRQFNHVCHGVWLQQVLVVQAVEEDVQSALCVIYLSLEG